MRVNVYSQELTGEVNRITKKAATGIDYTAVQFMLHSSPMLHNRPGDDERSAVTIWLPGSPTRREALALSLERAAELVRGAPTLID